MASLAQNVLSNTAWAFAIALVAGAASRIWSRRPALAHGLWLLVLIKLVTPSVLGFPLVYSSYGSVEDKPQTEPAKATPIQTQGPALLNRPAVVKSTSIAIPSGPTQVRVTVMSQELEPPGPPSSQVAWRWSGIILAIWLTGIAVWCFIIAISTLRFRRLLQSAVPAPEEIQERVETLAQALGLGSPPSSWVVPARIPPMLWAFSRRAKLLLPDELWNRLDEEQRDTILIHELAHLKRRDHWVRRLEAVVLGLYWWNPIAWWSRRELEKSEEECCDAWVIWARPKSADAYAEALVTTAAYLSGPRAHWPLGATGAGRTSPLKKRLLMILNNSVSRSPLHSTLISQFAMGLGIAMLLLLPAWATEPPKPQESTSESNPVPSQSKDHPSTEPHQADGAPIPNTPKSSTPSDTKSNQASERGEDEDQAPATKKHQGRDVDRDNKKPEKAATPLPTLEVYHPLVREISDSILLQGRLDASEKVEIRSEVAGRLEQIHFKSGALVKKGDTLFTIDSRSYQIEVQRAMAEVQRTSARRKLAALTLARKRELQKQNAVSAETINQAESDLADAEADANTAEASRSLAALKLASTKIVAPMDGKISRPQLSVGSVVAADITPLATIISTNTITVNFDINTYSFQSLYRAKENQDGQVQEPAHPLALVTINAPNLPTYRSRVDLDDHEVNSSAGTYRLRVTIPNANRAYLPGMMASVRIVTSPPRKAILIPAILVKGLTGPDKNGPWINVVNDHNVVERRNVVIAQDWNGEMAEIKEGLSSTDWVAAWAFFGEGVAFAKYKVQPKVIPAPQARGLFVEPPSDEKEPAKPKLETR